ncbi:phage protein [Bacillus thuringiensis serovar tolworthi]|uniref:Phage protein n=2 Tax=Bacillus TaxID=1386 RepID=A0A9W3ZSZ7_BACTO|nr:MULTISPECIES: hypothetical protein [Bacillus cereus group]MEB8712276.1 hypothetical protein [Bacillus cereus]MEB9593735.1 hypothetical protein [Bacillus cereus]BAR82344.1 phage protein [Bacillus thuringiensis serovar tolworthi]
MRLFEKICSFFKKKGMKLQILEVQINDLQREVESLNRSVYVLATKIDSKADKADVFLMIKQSEVVKKINESEPIRTDCKVNIKLDGKFIAESIAEHTADSIQGRVIKRSEINEIN